METNKDKVTDDGFSDGINSNFEPINPFMNTLCKEQNVVEINKIYFEDNLVTMGGMDDGCVDLLLQDTPFEVTQNKWDIKPDLEVMWPEWLRITKENAAIIFFATQPFASELILSMPKLFRYDLIWEKGERASGFLNANKMPLRSHETILVFYRSLPTYNPQFIKGKPTHKKGKPFNEKNNNYGEYNIMPTRDYGDKKFPKSVLYFDKPHPAIHPTEKPIDLIRYLILTYSNENDLVYDGYAGSGTTAAAAIIEKRNWICSENKIEFYEQSQNRILPYLTQTTLY